jgi:hypothetical protein
MNGLRCWILCLGAAAAASSCFAARGGNDGETHFVCGVDADCREFGADYICIRGECTAPAPQADAAVATLTRSLAEGLTSVRDLYLESGELFWHDGTRIYSMPASGGNVAILKTDGCDSMVGFAVTRERVYYGLCDVQMLGMRVRETGETEELIAAEAIDVAVLGDAVVVSDCGHTRLGSFRQNGLELTLELNDACVSPVESTTSRFVYAARRDTPMAGSEIFAIDPAGELPVKLGDGVLLGTSGDRVHLGRFDSCSDCGSDDAMRLFELQIVSDRGELLLAEPSSSVTQRIVDAFTDGDDVFITEQATSTRSGLIRRASLAGKPSETWVSGLDRPREIVVDEAAVYWSEGTDGSVRLMTMTRP